MRPWGGEDQAAGEGATAIGKVGAASERSEKQRVGLPVTRDP